jgi:hypothetical protein
MTPLTNPSSEPTTVPQENIHEAKAGDRGAASGRNIAQNRAIGQDDPVEGSRMGREQDKPRGYPGSEEARAGGSNKAHETADAEADKRKR